jgi:HipA-like protein
MTRLERLLKLRYDRTPPPTVQVFFDGTQVAELGKVEGKYFFRYLDAFREKGLDPLPGLPDNGKPLESVELFPFFEERIPDTRRPEIRERMQEMGLSDEDKLALLGALSRRTVTDSYQLIFNQAA